MYSAYVCTCSLGFRWMMIDVCYGVLVFGVEAEPEPGIIRYMQVGTKELGTQGRERETTAQYLLYRYYCRYVAVVEMDGRLMRRVQGLV